MGGSGINDVVDDGVAGLLANDEAELADDLLRLLQDKALRTRMAACPPSQVKRFDWDTVTPLYLAATATRWPDMLFHIRWMPGGS